MTETLEKPLLTGGRLRWACRRGMLELDILLGDFVDSGYAALSESDKRLFQALLDYPDQELYEFFMAKRRAESAGIQRIIDHIIEYTRTHP